MMVSNIIFVNLGNFQNLTRFGFLDPLFIAEVLYKIQESPSEFQTHYLCNPRISNLEDCGNCVYHFRNLGNFILFTFESLKLCILTVWNLTFEVSKVLQVWFVTFLILKWWSVEELWKVTILNIKVLKHTYSYIVT